MRPDAAVPVLGHYLPAMAEGQAKSEPRQDRADTG